MPDAARSLRANSTELPLLDFAIKKLTVTLVGTVTFELEATDRSDFRKLRKEKTRRGECEEPKEGDACFG